jgi:large subunit ribosomal protein L24
MRLKKNDQILVIRGKERGKRGRVMKVYPAEAHVLVEKINYQTAYLRRSQQNPQGGLARVEGKIHVSNVKLVCPRCGKPTRVGYSLLADGTKQRICKQCHEIV